MHVVDEQTFGHMTKKGELVSFIEKISNDHQHSNSLPNLIVYGQGGPRDTIVRISYYKTITFVFRRQPHL